MDDDSNKDNERFGKFNYDQFDHELAFCIYESVILEEQTLISKGEVITPELKESLKVRFTKEEYEIFMNIYGKETFNRYLTRKAKQEVIYTPYNGLSYSDYNAYVEYELKNKSYAQKELLLRQQQQEANQYYNGNKKFGSIILWGLPCSFLACMGAGITGVAIVIIICVIMIAKQNKPTMPYVPRYSMDMINKMANDAARLVMCKTHKGDPVFERYWQDRLEMEREGRQ